MGRKKAVKELTEKEWLEREKDRLTESTYKGKVNVFENDINPVLKNKHIKDIR